MSVLRILHLEEGASDAELVTARLAADGLACETVRVSNRREFEAALVSARFDVILSDSALPGFDGSMAQALALEHCPEVPFIFVSGTPGEELAVERLKAGASDYVLKQSLTRLAGAIRRAVQEADARAERHRADAELRRLHAELEERTALRTELARVNAELAHRQAEVNGSREEASSANRTKNLFLSRLSHDLRAPLSAILGFAQVLELEEPSPEHRESLAQILSAGRQLLHVLNEVLDIARIESGGLSLSSEPVSLAEIAEDAIGPIASLAAHRRVEVHALGPQPRDRRVLADRQRLTQILVNLLSNAIKYGPIGGRVTVSCDESSPRRVRLKVTDIGAGIPPEKLQMLFQPFQRLGAEHTAIEGTGLGLTICRGLAEAMGGTMGVESEMNVGTCFWVELEAVDGPRDVVAHAAHQTTVVAEPPRVKGTVLYVEDNSLNRRLVQRVLVRRPGVELLEATRGDAAVELARAKVPDLIFLDLHLPNMPGEEVLRQLWEDTRTREIPVAVLSADATPSQAKRLFAMGAFAHLTKPLDVAELLRLIDQTLYLKRH